MRTITGPNGLQLIRTNEGRELTAYLDKLAKPPVWTIGFGDTANVWPGLTITAAEAEERLLRRLAEEFEPEIVEALAGAPVTQSQFDAFASLIWNIGPGRLDNPDTARDETIAGFKTSRVVQHHKAGRYAEAAEAFKLWNKAGGKVLKGLVRRRGEEAALYLKGLQEPALVIAQKATQPAPYDRYLVAKQMQMALQKAGLYTGVIDGKWGKASRAAYDAFLNGG